jgi:hypothetical protein
MKLTIAIVGGARVAGHPHGTRWDPPERPLRCYPLVWDVITGRGSRSPYPQPAYPGGILPETGEAIPAYPAQGPDIAYGCCLGSTSERLRVLVYANEFANELTWTQPPEEGAPTPHADLLAVAARQSSGPQHLLWVPPVRRVTPDDEVLPAEVYAQITAELIATARSSMPTLERVWVCVEPGESLHAQRIREATDLLVAAGLPVTLQEWDPDDLVQTGRDWIAAVEGQERAK